MNALQKPGLMSMPGEQIKQSIFFIMINSNKTPEKLGQEGVNKFTQTIAHMKDHRAIMYYLMHADDRTPIPESQIVSLRSHSDVEVGQQKLMLHGNISIEVFHKTRVKIDLTKLRNELKSYLGYNCKVSITCPKTMPAATIDNFVRYASKNQIANDNVASNE
jgi:hypothetical protein